MRLAILTMQSCLRATGRQAGRIGRQAGTVCRPRQVALRVGPGGRQGGWSSKHTIVSSIQTYNSFQYSQDTNSYNMLRYIAWAILSIL